MLRPRYTLLPHGRDSSHRLVGPTPVTTFPRCRPTHELATTNAEFFESKLRKTHGLPLSDGGRHAISRIDMQGLLWTTQRQGGSGDLPYEVGCPAFTRELRQFQWPSHRTFKPDVGEKYNGKTHPSEFLSIYTIAMQATGLTTTRCSPTTFRWRLSPTSCLG